MSEVEGVASFALLPEEQCPAQEKVKLAAASTDFRPRAKSGFWIPCKKGSRAVQVVSLIGRSLGDEAVVIWTKR